MVKALKVLVPSLSSSAFRSFNSLCSSATLRHITTSAAAAVTSNNKSALNHHSVIARASSTYTRSKVSTDRTTSVSFTSFWEIVSISVVLSAEMNRWNRSIICLDRTKSLSRKCSTPLIYRSPWSTSAPLCLVNPNYLYTKTHSNIFAITHYESLYFVDYISYLSLTFP